MDQQTNATLARRLADDGHLLASAADAVNGERFFMVSIGLQTVHLLHSGTFRGESQAGERVTVQFDGEVNVRSKPADAIGIGTASQLVCLRSLEPLKGDYEDLRPAHERAMLV